MEIIISPASAEISRGIENKEQLKTELASQLEYYNTLAVTEDSLKAAKADRADLNKLRTAIDNKRKDEKKKIEGFFKPFENDCKELIAMIDKPIAAIDGQIKAFDEKKKAEKYAEIEAYFDENCKLNYVKLVQVIDPKWSNAGCKIENIKKDISDKLRRIENDAAEIKKLYGESQMLPAIMQQFEQTLCKENALAYAAQIERRERAEQERKQQAEQLEKQRQAKEKADREVVTKTIEDKPKSEPIGVAAFKVRGTREQIVSLRNFMRDFKIEYEVLKV